MTTTYFGEIIALIVAFSWTATALFADVASHRLGSLPLNLIRMVLSWAFLSVILWVVTGAPYPLYANGQAWFWLALSGLVGYVFGDWCLFNSYIVFGSRYGQLFMTLAPPMAGIAGWLMLGESMSWRSWLAMLVTLTGIAISILARGDEQHKLTLKLPLKGVLFSEDATAVSSDPSVFEIDEIIVMNYANHSWINGYFHKVGTSTITITDGDQEYVLEVSVAITPRGYHIEDKRIK